MGRFRRPGRHGEAGRRSRPVDDSRLLRAGSEGGPVAGVYMILIRQECTYLVRQFMCAGKIREYILFSVLFCCCAERCKIYVILSILRVSLHPLDQLIESQIAKAHLNWFHSYCSDHLNPMFYLERDRGTGEKVAGADVKHVCSQPSPHPPPSPP
jgi:hypothetical protein